MHSIKASLFAAGGSTLLAAMPLWPAHADPLPPPPERPQLDRNGVDIQTGDFSYEKTDLTIGDGSPGMGLSYIRYYNSATGWRDNFSNSLDVTEYPDYVISNQSVSFGNMSEGFQNGYSDLGQGSSLDGFVYTRKDGMQIAFSHLYLESVTPNTRVTVSVADIVDFPNGVRWTIHNKDGMGGGLNNTRIQSITSNTGYQLKFVYASNTMSDDFLSRFSWTQVIKVIAVNNAYEYCDPMADICSLSLAWPEANYAACTGGKCVTDALGQQTRYSSSFVSGIASFKVKTPESSTDNIVFNEKKSSVACVTISISPQDCFIGDNNRTSSVLIDGVETSYSYSYSSSSKLFTVESISPLNEKNVYVSHAFLPGVKSHKNPLLRERKFTYDLAGRLRSAELPEGNYWSFLPDGNGNILETAIYDKLNPITPSFIETRGYGFCAKVCNKPTTITDPRGGITTFTYYSEHGGVKTETGPAVGGVQAVKRYAYSQRYAWYKNAAGAYVRASFPVWVLSEMRTCITTATVGGACAGGAADEVVVSYEYEPEGGPNNLLVRGQVITSSGVSRRTCFGYDRLGRRVSETKPSANLAACP